MPGILQQADSGPELMVACERCDVAILTSGWEQVQVSWSHPMDPKGLPELIFLQISSCQWIL